MDDGAMLVRTEKTPQIAQRPTAVRVHTPIGSAVVLWRGDPQEADGHHLVEWTFDDDIRWGQNTHTASCAEPGIRQDGDRLLLRGRLQLTEDDAAYLQMGYWPVLFDVASPIPESANGAWVEISVEAGSVALYPYQT
ncbi:hypothetical protein OG345_40600 (plasmid) [Streptomyces sp. NBC_01220]|uniref:Uncharacterized protein n=1 Tax=Streptomyces poriferorum TaxID=2798799 RepID=A0ABY9J0V0_9ACTN|nr:MULTISPECIES: hypothetical protein [unclassified Streptomyces]MDP5309351.1 hypothetical protein [Streptomyces sp. Alt4]WLQ61445.1 hypothetical protein P8A19_41280 [Streptomyces sp. Alt2]WSQ49314.1 hypothetical protein OG345_40600 [Streptomyces sp. NBC_01220]